MEYIYALALLLILALAASVAIYLYLAHKEETPAKKPAAKKKDEPAAGAREKQPPYPLPPELPRTIATIKLLAQEDAEMVANICKRWLKE